MTTSGMMYIARVSRSLALVDEKPWAGCGLSLVLTNSQTSATSSLRDLELVGDAAELVLAQLGQELGHDLERVRLRQAALFEMGDLDRQALAQVARADADRLLGLQHAQHRAHLVDRRRRARRRRLRL